MGRCGAVGGWRSQTLTLLGERSAPARVQLRAAPRLELSRELRAAYTETATPSPPIVLHAGAELAFTVTIDGFPQPSFEALLNDEPLRRHALIDDFDQRAIRIRFPSLLPENSGELSFRAINDEGADMRRVHLRILAVPSAPSGLRVSLLSATSVELNWQAPRDAADADDETDGALAAARIEYYAVEKKTAEQSRWRSAGKLRPSASTPLRMIIDELLRDEIYVFRVYAVSGVGVGAASASVDVITPTDDDDDELSIASLPSESQSLAPDAPATAPTITINNRRAELTWPPVDGVAMYAIERRRENSNDAEMWLEVGERS